MENKKKSSIEQLELDLEIWFSIAKIYFPVEIKNSIERVKTMHKEEVKESYREGRSDQQSKETFYHRNSEQYYNETFGGESFKSNGTNHLSYINPLTDKLSLSNILDLYIKETARGIS